MTEPMEEGKGIRLIQRARAYPDRTALLSRGVPFSYSDLLQASQEMARSLLKGSDDLGEERIAFLLPGGMEYVMVQWGIWRAGGIAVPLSMSAKEPELEHVLSDAGVSSVLAGEEALGRLEPLCQRLGIRLESVPPGSHSVETTETGADTSLEVQLHQLPEIPPHRRAMMLYTSGTTNKPKGVVSSHANIEAQIRSLVDAWGWQADDRIPLFLPLHHIHGIVNVLSCALWSGATGGGFRRLRHERHPRPGRARGFHRFHGGSHHLCEAHPRSGGCRPGIPEQVDRGISADAPNGFGVSGPSCGRSQEVDRTHGAEAPGAVRNDRDRHGPLQSASG